jgi:hypothetical protein
VPEPKKLRDHPLIAKLERQAALNPEIAADRARVTHGEDIDHISTEVFGVTYDDIGLDFDDAEVSDAEWEAFATGYRLAEVPAWEQVKGFRELGWDVTDEHGRPLLVLHHFSWQLLAAIRGEFAAKLPGAVPISPDVWGSSIEAEARRFRSKGPNQD